MAQTHDPPIRGAETTLEDVHDRFGGTDIIAALLGMFTALGIMAFLGALLAAGAGEIPYQPGAFDADGNLVEAEAIGTAVALGVLFVSFLFGGWATGRMSRYAGGLNGFGAGLLFVLLTAVFAALGTFFSPELNAFQLAGLPDWFSGFDADDVTSGVVIAGVLGIAVTLFGGWLGGRFGEQYHHEADAAIVQETLERTG